MSTKVNFCGECGTPLEKNAMFCGECGTKITTSEEKEIKNPPKKKKPNPKYSKPGKKLNDTIVSNSIKPSNDFQEEEKITVEEIKRDSIWSSNSLSAAFNWAIIWAIGWLPIGVIISRFYDIKHALSPEFYAQYPRLWWSTLPGLTINFTIGAFIGGFIAGLVLYRFLNTKKLSLGIRSIIPIIAWIMFWVVLLGVLTFDIQGMDMTDDTIFIAMFLLSPIYASIITHFTIKYYKKTHNLIMTKRKSRFVAVYWAMCAFLSLMLMSVLGDLIIELF